MSRKMNNMSSVVVFSLSGFGATANYRITLFSLTVLCYCVIVVVNVSLILTIFLDQNLHEPMYIFFCNLCINAVYGASGFYPKFVSDLLSDIHVISYAGCLLQVFVIYSSVSIDLFGLALMAYDRYVAICCPLVYHSVMSVQRSAVLLSLTWIFPMCCSITILTFTFKLNLCGSHIQKLYCESWAIVKLACSSTAANTIVGLFFLSVYSVPFLFIAYSYIRLIKSTLKSKEGRKKFAQTCVPHLLCLLNVTAALLFDLMYSRYGSVSLSQSVKNFMAVQFLVIPPVLNPIIYGLILTKVRNQIIHLFMTALERFKLPLNISNITMF